MRDSNTAVAFRLWTREFSQTIQSGELTEIGRYTKELVGIVKDVNRYLGLDTNTDLSMKLGWGPVNISKAFSLPRLLQRPVYFKRHLWFLHDIYSNLVKMVTVSNHIERVLIPYLPDWFPPIKIDPTIWRHLRPTDNG